jgi:hypothetical protein
MVRDWISWARIIFALIKSNSLIYQFILDINKQVDLGWTPSLGRRDRPAGINAVRGRDGGLRLT